LACVGSSDSLDNASSACNFFFIHQRLKKKIATSMTITPAIESPITIP
jgi:hypothetical protein